MTQPAPPSVPADAATSLAAHLEQQRQRIDGRLEQLVPPEIAPPSSIHRAMRYSLFAGGKRLRPILCLETSRMLSAEPNQDIDAIASTLELIHTYSLIHDDLPALDDDDYRRGKPTCHKMFGEAMAILAGDALLTLAFRVLSTLPGSTPDVRSALVAELSDAAGTVDGMIGGQVADLEAVTNPPHAELLEYIHRSKTAALFRAAVSMGAIAERAEPATLARLAQFGQTAGLAFQIADDILDVESSTEALGKTAGKDAAQKKATYPALYGVERSRQMASEWIGEAKALLEPFGERASVLRELADRLVFRKT
ncbi:MAG: polyprenyl synthetase family protein [Acidobacteria bacterium]|nr:polyprenyl synthetase family protein [Acidobacteriota bacterium]